MPNSLPVARSGFTKLFAHEAHVDEVIGAGVAASAPQAFDRTLGDRREDAPYGSYRVANGVALIPVLGSLIPRGLFLGSGYITSYEAFGAEMRHAAQNPAVDSIALMIDSPGGYVSGIDAAAAAIKAAAAQKAVTAYVQGMACSAAYWLAAACDEIVCSPLAELGSIGVVQVHFDVSAMLDQVGVKVTLLHAGAKKVDGNPYEPLTERVKTEMNAELEDLRMAFAEAVAEGRPSLDVAAVLATEAATYRGDDAVKRGLADRIGLITDDLPDTDDPFVTSPIGRFMETVMNYTQAQYDAGVSTARTEGHKEGHAAGHKEGHAAGVTEGHAAGKTEGFEAGKTEGSAAGKAEGAKAERERIAGIKGSEEAKKRPQAAERIAMTTDMPQEAAVALLAGLPEEKASASLAKEMADDPDTHRAADVGDGGKKFEDLKGEEKGAAIAGILGLAKKKAA